MLENFVNQRIGGTNSVSQHQSEIGVIQSLVLRRKRDSCSDDETFSLSGLYFFCDKNSST